ncbi:pyrimidine 5'-nucleotidase [Robiginitomaculum antarcticum]|uniref:pyrimidine 5'-nucleotidase n=1 Tax=Robiginitomaculum antarcticum TaxID=437507 RepID=UPI0003AA2071|nr:pyrimidine 5'-nucleotidase [Robiginitomaculum antarcticum]
MSDSRIANLVHWIFDLDNTLYAADGAFFAQIDKKITTFISRYLSLQDHEARLLQKSYLVEYGTSLSGLMAVNGMDPAEFLDYVHDVDLDALKPSPALRAAIEALPGQRLIYTNGSKAHAKNVATHLNLFDLFDGSFGVEDGHYVPKPKPEPYTVFNTLFDVEPTRAIFFEDSLRNLKVPHTMDMVTVLITNDFDWSHEPEDVRPGGAGRFDSADYDHVDVITSDLSAWLSERVGES